MNGFAAWIFTDADRCPCGLAAADPARNPLANNDNADPDEVAAHAFDGGLYVAWGVPAGVMPPDEMSDEIPMTIARCDGPEGLAAPLLEWMKASPGAGPGEAKALVLLYEGTQAAFLAHCLGPGFPAVPVSFNDSCVAPGRAMARRNGAVALMFKAFNHVDSASDMYPTLAWRIHLDALSTHGLALLPAMQQAARKGRNVKGKARGNASA
jgi:hypothetical protein